MPAAYSKSELATAMPSSGGTYVYIERAFGPLFGTISGIGLWLALVLKCAFALVGIGAYVLVVLGMDSAVITKTVALVFLSAVFLLNIVGAKKREVFSHMLFWWPLLFLQAFSFLDYRRQIRQHPFLQNFKTTLLKPEDEWI